MKLNLTKYQTKIIFLVLLLIAIGVRVYSWPNGIPDVNCDEAMTAVNAKFMAGGG